MQLLNRDPVYSENAGLTTRDSLSGSMPVTPSISSSRESFMCSQRRFPSTLNSIGTDFTPKISPIKLENRQRIHLLDQNKSW